jgi:hypothetical protein
MILFASLAACQAYQPGALSPGPGGAAASLECADVVVSPRPDVYATGPVVEIAVGNRCDHPIEIDYGAIRAIGHRAFDPRGEIRRGVLDARSMAVEVIEYRPIGGAGASLCLDLSGFAAGGGGPPVCVSHPAAVAEVTR